MLSQEPLDEPYKSMPLDELHERIGARKAELGDRLVILGHHYQPDEVIRHADFTGDSLKLAKVAAEQTGAAYIVFCGVHFMAESADILTGDDQAVILPDVSAGCPMAEMADDVDFQAALDEVAELAGGAKIAPVTYVNSTAAVKAVTGRNGGACCTSGNCAAVLAWALRAQSDGGAGAEKVFAAPDQHLVRATALDMGYRLDDCVVYRPGLPDGGLTAEAVGKATFILWDGYCNVHMQFRVEQIERRRREHPDVTVIVHPECEISVVQAADLHGSTEQIIRAVAAGEPGSTWAVGTEGNLVGRLARRHEDRLVMNLSDRRPLCATMNRIDPGRLCWTLDRLAAGDPVNRVTVEERTAADAAAALGRMVGLAGSTEASPSVK